MRNCPLTTACLLLCGLVGCRAQPPEKFDVELNVATTRIVEPLDDAGYVDYLEAANVAHARGVSPEDNWEVVVRRAFGPLAWDEASNAEYYRRLGIAPLPPRPRGDYIELLASEKGASELEKKRQDQFWNIEGPWRAEDYPEFAAWLRSQDEIWDRLVDGSQVSRHYIPLVMSGEAHATRTAAFLDSLRGYENSSQGVERWAAALFKSIAKPRGETAPLSRWHLVDIVQQSREACRMLIKRALLRVTEGDTAGAKSDLLAVHRIARLFSQGMLDEWFMGHAIEGMACHGDAELLKSGKLTRESCVAYLADLNCLAPLAPAATQLDTNCRYVGLDAIQFAARQHRELFEMLKSEDASRQTRNAFARIDWNQAMRLFNQRCDQFVRASLQPDTVQRLAETKQVAGERISAKDDELAEQLQQVVEQTGDLTTFMGKVYFDRYIINLALAELKQHAYLRVVRTAYAAQLYRFDHGAYPTTIEALRPILNEVPLDPFSGTPLRLALTSHEFAIYSVGENQVDDGGYSIGARSEVLGDDFQAIRMKR